MPRKTKASEGLPIRPESFIKEDDSKDIFSELIKPWMISTWIQGSKDFGIDAVIEITKPIANRKYQVATGKKFSLQIKSSAQDKFSKQTLALPIERNTINYWMQSFQPVLLVYMDLNSQKAYLRWIDESLIQELYDRNGSWVTQETVSISFDKSQQLNRDALSKIEKYVLSWRRPSKSLLTPGSYFNYSTSAHQYALRLKAICEKHHINFLEAEVEELCRDVSQAIYTIAIVGPSRAGKSTLINALLQKEVSPVDILPTTGIPISIFPKNEEKAYITFTDGRTVSGKVTSAFLAEYTSQDRNPKNYKGVKHVKVNIVNTLMERGFAMCDVPGLDDADPQIRSIVKTTLCSVNAIIYVISLAPYLHGEFKITDKNIEELNDLRSSKDKVFLVFNKTDLLQSTQLEEVKRYIEKELHKYEVTNFLAVPPLYISSEKAFINRKGKDFGLDSVSSLEQILWEHLINQSRTGLHKLLSNFSNNMSLSKKLRNLVETRMSGSERRVELEVDIKNVNDEIQRLQTFIFEQRSKAFTQINAFVTERFDSILKHLNQELTSIPINQALPDKNGIASYLEEEAYRIISDAYDTLQGESFLIQSETNKWVAERLRQVEFYDELARDIKFTLPEVYSYTSWIHSFFVDNRIASNGIFEAFAIRIVEALEWVATQIQELLTDNATLRKRSIAKTMQLSKKSYVKIRAELMKSISEFLSSICSTIEYKTQDRAKIYLGELKNQMDKLEFPLGDDEADNLRAFAKSLVGLEHEVVSNYNHLEDYTHGTHWIRKVESSEIALSN